MEDVLLCDLNVLVVWFYSGFDFLLQAHVLHTQPLLFLSPSDHNHLNNAALSPLGPAMALSHPHNNLGIGFNKYTSLKAVGEYNHTQTHGQRAHTHLYGRSCKCVCVCMLEWLMMWYNEAGKESRPTAESSEGKQHTV